MDPDWNPQDGAGRTRAETEELRAVDRYLARAAEKKQRLEAIAGTVPSLLDPPPGCRFQVFEDTAHPIYFGTVAPQSVDLTCASS